MLKIEEGKFYQTRDGRKVGPIEKGEQYESDGPWMFKYFDTYWMKDGTACVCPRGEVMTFTPFNDLVSEWIDFDNPNGRPVSASPIVTVTKRELRDGVYGRFHIMRNDGKSVFVGFSFNGGISHCQPLNANDLREAAHLFNQIAEFLEDGN